MLGMRAFQALDNDPSLFPVHRVLRFAVRRPLEDVFDDLALHAAPRAQRLEAGAVIFEGEGFFASATGRRKTDYSSGTIRVWTRDLVRLREVEADILRAIGDQMVREEQFTIDWYFHGAHGGLTNVSFEELADPALIDEAYPSIEGGRCRFHRAVPRGARHDPGAAGAARHRKDAARARDTRGDVATQARQCERSEHGGSPCN